LTDFQHLKAAEEGRCPQLAVAMMYANGGACSRTMRSRVVAAASVAIRCRASRLNLFSTARRSRNMQAANQMAP
jgi:hypothetical protein